MIRILFANHAQFEGEYTNLGDWAIFESMIDSLKQEIINKEIQIMVPSANPSFTNRKYPVQAFRKGIVNTVRAIKKSDIVLIGGGEIVQDLSSLVYIPYQLIRPLVAKFYRKKLFAYAIGVGEEWEISRIGKMQAKIVLSMFDVITVRDEKSKRILQDYIKVRNKNIVITADPAINLTPKEIIRKEKDEYIVVSVRSVYHRNHNILPFAIRKKLGFVSTDYYIAIDEFKKTIGCFLNQYMEKYPYKVKFLATYSGRMMSAEDDLFTNEIVNMLINKERVEIIEEKQPKKVKYILSKSRLVISVPLHPLILAASENIPVISMAYASKSMAFMEQLAMQRYVYKVTCIKEKIEVDKILKSIKEIEENYEKIRIEIAKKMMVLKDKEKENPALLLGLVELIEREKIDG